MPEYGQKTVYYEGTARYDGARVGNATDDTHADVFYADADCIVQIARAAEWRDGAFYGVPEGGGGN